MIGALMIVHWIKTPLAVPLNIQRCELFVVIALSSLHYSDVIMGAMASPITSLTIVYSTVYSGADKRKHQSPGGGDFPAQRASNAENDSIRWRHQRIYTVAVGCTQNQQWLLKYSSECPWMFLQYMANIYVMLWIMNSLRIPLWVIKQECWLTKWSFWPVRGLLTLCSTVSLDWLNVKLKKIKF